MASYLDSTRRVAPTRAVAPGAARGRGYLHQLDFVRTITFLLVVFMHAMTNTNDEVNGVVTNAIAMNLHFTRNTFFALTGLVLAYGVVERGARLSPVQFWRKRLPLVVIPFVIWAFAYWVFDMALDGRFSTIPSNFGEFWDNLKWGGLNGYQLYFIFVTIQIYLLFPLVLALAERTRGAHGRVLVVSGVVQVAIYALATYWNPTTGWWGENFWHIYATFIPYQFFILLGVLTAFHRDRIEAMLLRNVPLVFGVAGATMAGALALYSMRIDDETAPIVASAVFQPANFVLYVALVAAVYTTGLLLARHRHRVPRLTRFAAYGTKRSFGVFLVHVMVLSALLLPKTADGTPWLTAVLPSPVGTVVAYVITIVVTLGIVELLSRAPKAQWWVGRPRQKPRPARSPQQIS
ncbi:acyltransferase [Tsukamurella paurometabola]|uniref:Acyltransferase 3 n=1 Tax=Tsukamurella paurometabola (strain ATCC 8368 / DSM 20162 / CCUG 35730 / CIP 100753 / JCM 10117 / KCTC 9821 / NBRC 16120 / NCIMB 702349 / NCTC 13040) TaxID=521096 RepID=D5UYC9_TSUPD|nr:acyltransferase [Tsukamurella paurometabola]ADG78236.1 acyltransferase 3 [Tsukamurella paurometabola DSM 20162]